MMPFTVRAQRIDQAFEDPSHALWSTANTMTGAEVPRIMWNMHGNNYLGVLNSMTLIDGTRPCTELTVSNTQFAQSFLARLGNEYVGWVRPLRNASSPGKRDQIPSWLIEKAYVIR